VSAAWSWCGKAQKKGTSAGARISDVVTPPWAGKDYGLSGDRQAACTKLTVKALSKQITIK